MIIPRSYQLEGKQFIEKNKHLGTLLWWGLGLGKTLVSLWSIRDQLARLRAQGVASPKFLVIMPKSAITTWQVECQTNTPDLYRDMIMIPYSQLNKAPRLIMYYDIRIIVMDESHYIKSADTNRAKDLSAMLSHLDSSTGKFKNGKIIMLSGTPMLNSAAEFYTTWAILASPNCGEAATRLLDEKRYERWTKSFAMEKEKRWKTRGGEKKGSMFEGVQNVEMLQELLGPITSYKRVADCIDLPEKQETHINLDLPDDKLLKDANIEEPENYMELLEKLSRAKTPHAIEWVKEFLHNGQEQLVIFSSYKFPIQEIRDRFPNVVVMVTGEENSNDRKSNIEAFQAKKKRIICLTYGAGAESLNLQNAHVALYLGWPWTDGKLKQAMGRIYRSGQKNFTLHFFLTSGFNDSRILTIVRNKEEATNEVEEAMMKRNVIQVDDYI